eukprot:CAMPEP_0197614488 /NCGR_PEP_ID=MMETSP1326-20131121/59546_1 /TAXON_ID=1155430 /ORGANISM="Genus nov. species nov., Strain RCC2288" /LENGTH=387 /DNA_ID=CAMNT_0043183361 /DNA_START=1483 /DNA_END=2647 /DNA_ORIENTATION=+
MTGRARLNDEHNDVNDTAQTILGTKLVARELLRPCCVVALSAETMLMWSLKRSLKFSTSLPSSRLVLVTKKYPRYSPVRACITFRKATAALWWLSAMDLHNVNGVVDLQVDLLVTLADALDEELVVFLSVLLLPHLVIHRVKDPPRGDAAVPGADVVERWKSRRLAHPARREVGVGCFEPSCVLVHSNIVAEVLEVRLVVPLVMQLVEHVDEVGLAGAQHEVPVPHLEHGRVQAGLGVTARGSTPSEGRRGEGEESAKVSTWHGDTIHMTSRTHVIHGSTIAGWTVTLMNSGSRRITSGWCAANDFEPVMQLVEHVDEVGLAGAQHEVPVPQLEHGRVHAGPGDGTRFNSILMNSGSRRITSGWCAANDFEPGTSSLSADVGQHLHL